MDPNDSSIPGLQEVRRSPFSFEVIDEKPVNRQLFENSVLHDDPVVEAEQNDPDRLFSTVERGKSHDQPNLAIIHETAKHRLIVYLKAQGLSNKEIATKTGFTEPWVSQLTRQPWFRLRLVTELKDAGIDAIQSVLKSSALDSVFTLIDIRDDLNAPKAVKAACANSLLDRFLGKATQTIQHEDKKLPKTSEISAIDQQIADLDKQINSKPNTTPINEETNN